MASFPPELARRLTIQIYVGIASFAVIFNLSSILGKLQLTPRILKVLLWDIIIHAPDEYKMFTKYRLTYMSIVHVISR